MDISVHPYTHQEQQRWDQFVEKARNSTFLLKRPYMDYHADRFHDTSLVFERGNKIVAVLPANYDHSSKTVWTHQGLTYGGLILSEKCNIKEAMECFDLLMQHYKALGAEQLIYKPLPYIYHNYPTEEPLYALFRHQATLISRGISSCIDLKHRLPIAESRKSGTRKAERFDIKVYEGKDENDIYRFHKVLSQCLMEGHNTKPVHSPEEMCLLQKRFPDNIRLVLAEETPGAAVAGGWVFDCGNVVHTQYLAASRDGKKKGALDKIIASLIDSAAKDHRYFDFGISTEQGGTILNEGLIFQKEGFGGRGVCYDAWLVKLQS